MTNRYARALSLLLGLSLLCGSPLVANAATAKFTWDTVTTHTDGTPLAAGELGGYKLHYGTVTVLYNGTDADQGNSPVEIPFSTMVDPNNPSFELTGLATCQHYFFAVSAYTTTGEESGYSIEAAGTLVDTPLVSAPQVIDSSELRISWNGLDPNDLGQVQNYLVHYDVDPGQPYGGSGATQGASPVSVAGNLFGFRLTGLTAGTTYYLVVQATCPDGTNKSSAEVRGTTVNLPPDMGVPPSPDMGVPPPPQGDAGPPPPPDSSEPPAPADQGISRLPDQGNGVITFKDASVTPHTDTSVPAQPPSPESDGGSPGFGARGGATLTGGCSVGEGPHSYPLVLLLALALLWRRRTCL